MTIREVELENAYFDGQEQYREMHKSEVTRRSFASRGESCKIGPRGLDIISQDISFELS
jgi:hypothetical protein